jgi:tetratricopeptide (TPR) repeat protein
VVALGAIAFLAQGLVDVDWSLLAQGVLVYAAIGAIAPAPHQQSRVTAPARAIAGAVCIGLIFAGLVGVPTWLSARDSARSDAILIENPQAAYEAAASAHRYNPLSVEALLSEANALQELGDTQGAQATLRQAIALEPKNYETWLAYGTYLAYAWGQLEQGRAALQQALKLSGNDGSVYVVVDTLPPAE